ncbi:MAG: Crp/Fnr family transcriptional regulator [Nitrospira sp.]|nr:Crp/Fnr family transcriptional regulator [Nitrospira sp.]
MIKETLKKSEVFSCLKDNEIEGLTEYFDEISLEDNETVFSEGDPSEKFYMLAEGNIKVLKHTVMGKDIILEIMSPGDIFGGVAVLDNKPFPASAQAMKASKIIRIRRQNLLKIMEEYPILKLEMVKYFSDKLRDAHEMLKNIATERVERRIASLLLKLSEKAGSEENGFRTIAFPLTRQEISEMVGTTVETCIRTMSKFQKTGLVKSAAGVISVEVSSLQSFLQE